MTTDEIADRFMDGLVCKFVERKDIVELIELSKDCAIVDVLEHLQKTRVQRCVATNKTKKPSVNGREE